MIENITAICPHIPKREEQFFDDMWEFPYKGIRERADFTAQVLLAYQIAIGLEIVLLLFHLIWTVRKKQDICRFLLSYPKSGTTGLDRLRPQSDALKKDKGKLIPMFYPVALLCYTFGCMILTIAINITYLKYATVDSLKYANWFLKYDLWCQYRLFFFTLGFSLLFVALTAMIHYEQFSVGEVGKTLLFTGDNRPATWFRLDVFCDMNLLPSCNIYLTYGFIVLLPALTPILISTFAYHDNSTTDCCDIRLVNTTGQQWTLIVSSLFMFVPNLVLMLESFRVMSVHVYQKKSMIWFWIAGITEANTGLVWIDPPPIRDDERKENYSYGYIAGKTTGYCGLGEAWARRIFALGIFFNLHLGRFAYIVILWALIVDQSRNVDYDTSIKDMWLFDITSILLVLTFVALFWFRLYNKANRTIKKTNNRGQLNFGADPREAGADGVEMTEKQKLMKKDKERQQKRREAELAELDAQEVKESESGFEVIIENEDIQGIEAFVDGDTATAGQRIKQAINSDANGVFRDVNKWNDEYLVAKVGLDKSANKDLMFQVKPLANDKNVKSSISRKYAWNLRDDAYGLISYIKDCLRTSQIFFYGSTSFRSRYVRVQRPRTEDDKKEENLEWEARIYLERDDKTGEPYLVRNPVTGNALTEEGILHFKTLYHCSRKATEENKGFTQDLWGNDKQKLLDKWVEINQEKERKLQELHEAAKAALASSISAVAALENDAGKGKRSSSKGRSSKSKEGQVREQKRNSLSKEEEEEEEEPPRKSLSKKKDKDSGEWPTIQMPAEEDTGATSSD